MSTAKTVVVVGAGLAGAKVDLWGMAPDIQALIGTGAPVDRDHLADTSVALGDLLPAAAHEA